MGIVCQYAIGKAESSLRAADTYGSDAESLSSWNLCVKEHGGYSVHSNQNL